uniref:Uncharacterized protein n=1 Tax=Arundo donax TaxID=35708 RepID=A0A0A8ZB04_ARUDO
MLPLPDKQSLKY